MYRFQKEASSLTDGDARCELLSKLSLQLVQDLQCKIQILRNIQEIMFVNHTTTTVHVHAQVVAVAVFRTTLHSLFDGFSTRLNRSLHLSGTFSK